MPQLVALKQTVVYCCALALSMFVFQINLSVSAAQEAGRNEELRRQTQIQADRYLIVFDKNKDGFLSIAEGREMNVPVDRLRFDFDKDNRLSRTELAIALSQMPGKAKQDIRKLKLIEEYLLIANAMLETYDENGNGTLEGDEFSTMRRRPSKAADLNRNGELSKPELAITLSRNAFSLLDIRDFEARRNSRSESPNGRSPDTKSSNEKKSPVNEALAAYAMMDFLKNSMKNNDTNKNNQLDSEEIARAQWASSWQKSDKNGDGVLSYAEMADRYRLMFGLTPEAVAKSALSMQGDSKTGSDSLEKKALVAIKTPKRVEGFRGAQRANTQARDNARTVQSSKASQPERPMAKGRNLNAQIYLLKAPGEIRADRVRTFVKTIEEANANEVANRIDRTKSLVECEAYDSLRGPVSVGVATTLNDRTEVYARLSQVGESSGRDPEMAHWEEGLMAKLMPRNGPLGITIDLEVEKTDGNLTEDRTAFEGQSSWSFDSTVEIEAGKPRVVMSSSNNQHWILIVCLTSQ